MPPHKLTIEEKPAAAPEGRPPSLFINRGMIPAFEMSVTGGEPLRDEGIMVTSVVDSVVNDPRRLRPHYHDFFQMMLLCGGSTVMHDFRDYTVSDRTLLFISPGHVHTIRRRRGFDGITISFTQGFFDHHTPPPSVLFSLPFLFPTDGHPLLPIPPSDPHRITEAFEEIQREFGAVEAGAAEVLRAWLRILFTRILRLYESSHPPGQPSRQSLLVRQFLLAVERSFRGDHTLAEYAQELKVTPNHLNDVVRAEMRCSAGNIIRKRRLLDAQRLLVHSDLTVAEISYQTGFPDPSYFGRFFRRETGKTPAAFRDQIREKYHSKAR